MANINFIFICCAGWVCYAEKTHGNFILPYISTTKSPQQIMGSLIKDWVSKNLSGRSIYHVTVMPCYDKKLEAAREDFFNQEIQSRDVDCVITASISLHLDFCFLYYIWFLLVELEQMLQNDGITLQDVLPSTFSEPWTLKQDLETKPILKRHIGSGSGGYADHIFQYASKELFGLECDKLEYKNLRYF